MIFTLLLVWAVVGAIWFFNKYTSRDDPKFIDWRVWFSVFVGGPIIWVLYGIYLMGEDHL